MSTEHTQGRLIVKWVYSIYADDGKTPVADTSLTNSIPDKDEANARRLAACWNACEGIETRALELMVGDLSIKEQITAFGKAKPRPATHRAIVYRQQRDELRDALKSLCNRIDTEGATPLDWVEYENALKASAKAEGSEA